MSNSLRPHEPQQARLPCPSPTPGVYPNPRPLSQWCHPTILSSVVPLSSLPSIFPSIRVFSNESALRIRWPKYWSYSFSIKSFQWIFRVDFLLDDCFNILAVQGTLKGLLQGYSSKVSILQCSIFFLVQLSKPYMTTEKPSLWLYSPLLAKWCLCFLIYYLGWSWLFFQESSVY